ESREENGRTTTTGRLALRERVDGRKSRGERTNDYDGQVGKPTPRTGFGYWRSRTRRFTRNHKGKNLTESRHSSAGKHSIASRNSAIACLSGMSTLTSKTPGIAKPRSVRGVGFPT